MSPLPTRLTPELVQHLGELRFVPTGDDHRFLDFSDDFSTWVLFNGPEVEAPLPPGEGLG
jgi:hypothetical protein